MLQEKVCGYALLVAWYRSMNIQMQRLVKQNVAQNEHRVVEATINKLTDICHLHS